MKIKVDNNLDEIVEKLNYLGFKKAGWIGYKNPKFITTNSKGFYTDHGADLFALRASGNIYSRYVMNMIVSYYYKV